MRKTEVLYTRIIPTNENYLSKITRKANLDKKTSRATCLDHMLSFMRENMSDDLILKEIAKRRNKVWQKGKHVSRHTSAL